MDGFPCHVPAAFQKSDKEVQEFLGTVKLIDQFFSRVAIGVGVEEVVDGRYHVQSLLVFEILAEDVGEGGFDIFQQYAFG